MVGLPASGKSTIVKELYAGRKDVEILSSDAIIETKCSQEGITYTEGFSKFIDEATKMFNANLQIAIKEHKNICIDRTNLTKKSRAKFLKMVPESYKRIAIVVECNSKDHMERLNSRVGKQIPYHVVENMINTYEHPSLDEGFDDITIINTLNQKEE
jgi:tRNA uridine 5-carbamoylmethylation protein Kti12